MKKIMPLLIVFFLSVIVFIILFVPFFEQSLGLLYFRFLLILALGFAFYKILKLKINWELKKTNKKYWVWTFLLIVFAVLGDFMIGGKYFTFSSRITIFLLPLLVAFSEELIARVIILQTVADEFGFKIGLAVQAVIFTLFHFDARPLALLYYMLFGIWAGLLIGKKGNFIYPLAAHYIADTIILWIRYPLL